MLLLQIPTVALSVVSTELLYGLGGGGSAWWGGGSAWGTFFTVMLNVC